MISIDSVAITRYLLADFSPLKVNWFWVVTSSCKKYPFSCCRRKVFLKARSSWFEISDALGIARLHALPLIHRLQTVLEKISSFYTFENVLLYTERIVWATLSERFSTNQLAKPIISSKKSYTLCCGCGTFLILEKFPSFWDTIALPSYQ